jgi:hypothetical protein
MLSNFYYLSFAASYPLSSWCYSNTEIYGKEGIFIKIKEKTENKEYSDCN